MCAHSPFKWLSEVMDIFVLTGGYSGVQYGVGDVEDTTSGGHHT
jgi:hypothetical protein